jgi:hypothetical protein
MFQSKKMSEDWPWTRNPQDAVRRRVMGIIVGFLSERLLRHRFFWVLGTMENLALVTSGLCQVERKEPLTWDQNNGVVVVYDEEGRPWIIRRTEAIDLLIETFCRDFGLQRGAYVPHSNDGGKFIKQHLENY